MPLVRTWAFSMPTLSERVSGIKRLIDEKLEVIRLKKHGEQVYLRMVISDNPKGYPNLEERLTSAYEDAGWNVSFAHSTQGTEIILR